MRSCIRPMKMLNKPSLFSHNQMLRQLLTLKTPTPKSSPKEKTQTNQWWKNPPAKTSEASARSQANHKNSQPMKKNRWTN